ncbi:GTP cyclohydrolase 1 type 2/Nif3 [Naematelia encephala]|uniref:GTP cyclohydrolase 1 type 2/Nif3 n=1 Tax=Naematelia encephala TaxID=71784 RepID=A0A1Y2ATK1_9TREE|nr:GTP cyclohydrolase 1 type 2/Nif3 [Naematelia encephala]
MPRQVQQSSYPTAPPIDPGMFRVTGLIPAQVAPIHYIKRVWERIAPLQLADKSWDNVGVMIEAPYPVSNRKRVLLTIDLTAAVCDEALSMPDCGVIVSYHPPIFRALKSMTLSDPIQTSLLRLASKGISVFSPHTSLDATPNGINTWLVEPFIPIASSSTPLVPSDPPISGFEGAGSGKLVILKQRLCILDIAKMVKDHLGLQYVQIACPEPELTIGSIAVCAGSGGSMFKDVKADLLFTGEMSHHEVLAAVARHQGVILCNHTNTERPYLRAVLQPWLEKELNNDPDNGESGWSVSVSQSDADPLRVV